MVSKFQKHIEQGFSFLKGNKLLLTVSGGIDSVVLVHLFQQLKYEISIAHCNFKLRGKQSDLDEQFVIQLANYFDIPCYTISFDTEMYAKEEKISIQMAARDLRYEWFEEIRKANKFDFVLTAHHADDVLETFLINLTRGTGLEGLTGIPAVNGSIVRPLLKFTRVEIEKFAIKNNIEWREDKSNASTKYFRNKIRHQVIPVLKELNPSLMTTFEKTINHLNGSQQIINDTIDQVSHKIISRKVDILQLSIEEVKKLNAPKTYLFELLRSYNFTEWEDVVHLLDAQSGKQILSKTHRLVKDREFLLLTEISKENTQETHIITDFKSDFSLANFTLKFELKETTHEEMVSVNSINVDYDKIEFPLTLRKWQHGDFFYPVGMKGKKKLSNFFKDEKMSIINKERVWLLVNSDNEIIWVVGRRLDRRFQILSTSKEAAIISYAKNTSAD